MPGRVDDVAHEYLLAADRADLHSRVEGVTLDAVPRAEGSAHAAILSHANRRAGHRVRSFGCRASA